MRVLGNKKDQNLVKDPEEEVSLSEVLRPGADASSNSESLSSNISKISGPPIILSQEVQSICSALREIILDSKNESRSKTSDYDEALEPLMDLQVLQFCRVTDEFGAPLNWRGAFKTVRKFLFRYWKRQVLRSWISYK